MVQEDAVNTAAGRLRGDIDRLRDDLRNLTQNVASLFKHGLGAGKSASTKVGDRFKDMPNALGNKVSDAIDSKPVAVIGTAFAAGLIAGLLLSHRRD